MQHGIYQYCSKISLMLLFLERIDELAQNDDSLSTYDIESVYSKAYNDIQFRDSFTSFWSNSRSGSALLQPSEGSLDFITDENLGRC